MPDWAAQKGGSQPVAGMQKMACEDPDNWNALRVGMTQSEVRRILGSPIRTNRYRSGGTEWIYPHGGAVYFTPRGRVMDWNRPEFSDRYCNHCGRYYYQRVTRYDTRCSRSCCRY